MSALKSYATKLRAEAVAGRREAKDELERGIAAAFGVVADRLDKIQADTDARAEGMLADRDSLAAERDEWKAAAQLRMTTGFAQGMRAQLQCQVRLDQAPEWLAGFDFAAEMFGEPRRLSGATDS